MQFNFNGISDVFYNKKNSFEGLILFEFDDVLYQSIALWMLYQKSFETKSIQTAVRTQIDLSGKRSKDGARIGSAIFPHSPLQFSSYRHQLKSKVVEHTVSYRLMTNTN